MEPVLQIVTFLMTDVVESSPLWEQDPAAMGLAAARHDELASGIVGAHGGRLVKPRGEGDSLFIVFSDPRDAVRCAAELRDAMEREPWPTRSALRIRAAVNTGPIEARAGDYYGSASRPSAGPPRNPFLHVRRLDREDDCRLHVRITELVGTLAKRWTVRMEDHWSDIHLAHRPGGTEADRHSYPQRAECGL